MIRHACRSLLLGAAASLAVACSEPQARTPELRLSSEDFAYQISADNLPPYARENTRFKVVVLDKETRQPVQGGEGRIFATNHDGMSIYDGFAPGETNLGTYYATLSFITAGDWAMALQFRTDSARALQRVDWLQQIRAERPLGTQ